MKRSKDAILDRLYKAAADYIKVIGGNAVVIGGTEIQDWQEGPYKFVLAIRVCGTRPPKPSK